jgi:hypothetical protein
MNGSEEEKVHRTVERVARESYGRLVGIVIAAFPDSFRGTA